MTKNRRRVIGMFDTDMLTELERMGEVSFDTKGRCRGFSGFVDRLYRRSKR
jgi:hypothetical protein